MLSTFSLFSEVAVTVANFLERVGEDLGKGAKAVGTVLAPVARRTAEVVSGEAPELDAEKRQRQYAMEDQQIAARAQMLENQLAMGEKYGTLTPQQRQQYVDAITGLYSHPRHAGTLMEKLRKVIHPNGAVATPSSVVPSLTDATPKGGTAAADQANSIALAQARYHAQPKKGFDQFLEVYTREQGIDPEMMTEAQIEDAHAKYYQQTHQAMLDKEIVEDPQSPTGFSVSEIDKRTGKVVSSFQGVLPRAGFVPKHRVSYSKDQYGNETMTVSDVTPVIGGAKSAGTETKPAAPSSAPPRPGGVAGAIRPLTSKPGGAPSVVPKTSAPAGLPPLDAAGHIPPSPAVNPQVLELANELLDGKDLKDIPQKAKAPAAELARQYGWEQGTFTPKEKLLINEAGTKLRQLRDSKSLDVLNSTTSRLKIGQVLASADKQNMVGRILSTATAGHLTPEEQEFVRYYNAAVGVISGLAPLTRGGRPTEASIHRLMQEMPSVLQSGNADDARGRLDQLLQEIEVAKGTKGTTPLGATGVGGSLGGTLEDRLNKAYEGSPNAGPH